jgi:hypothetical protein
LRPCGCTLGKDGRQVDECAFHLGEKLARAERLAPSATEPVGARIRNLERAPVLLEVDGNPTLLEPGQELRNA